jgi:hypothetical protein
MIRHARTHTHTRKITLSGWLAHTLTRPHFQEEIQRQEELQKVVQRSLEARSLAAQVR